MRISKKLSTPADPSEAVLVGIDSLDAPESSSVVHGSTVATNALLERRGARTALITTAGFADVLFIGRQNRTELYALVPQNPKPLVPRSWRYEVMERVTAEGEILHPLDETSLETIVTKLGHENIESVAVSLLFSFLRPEHEQKIRDRLQKYERPLHISLSSEILPEFREFERTSTTVINAYVGPLMEKYLNRLSEDLAPRPLTIMQSNGGIIQAKRAGKLAARTVLSGPAGGVVGARYVAKLAGYDDIISFDMGGTSTDVSLCPGRLLVTTEGEIGGFPLGLPMIDIHTVGAGGGSLAYVDPGGALHVGPQSAGADPGPACYRRIVGKNEKGLRPTTTDANLILGRLDKDYFLGGTIELDIEAAEKVLRQLAEEMGIASALDAAWGVVQIANSNMQRALRRISIERGYDPRNFTLVAFGGAGPLHACELAQNLHIPRVLIPNVPGVLSALGMLSAQPSLDYSLTIMRRLPVGSQAGIEWINEYFEALELRAMNDMAAEGYFSDQLMLIRQLDMRYVGQAHEITVTLTTEETELQVAQRLHEKHQERYAYQRPEVEVEIVNVRCMAVALVKPPALQRLKKTKSNISGPDISGLETSGAVLGNKPVWFGNQNVKTLLLKRAKLSAEQEFTGPAIVFQYDTTTVIPPMWEATVDEYGNLLLHTGL